MKGYYIEITNNLLDLKHRKAMKESVWLFMWFLDKMTSISEEGIGKVLGGKPIKYEEVKEDLGISTRTYRRWIDNLKNKGYLDIKRTPYGCVITVNKAKKTFGKKAKRCATIAERCAINGKRYATLGTSNIRQHKDNTRRQPSSKKKPFFNGEQMRFSRSKWWVLPADGSEWLEFAGLEKDIVYR